MEAGVFSVVSDLTPDIAVVLMERNPGNRVLKPIKVRDLSNDLKSGDWKFNGEAIIVSDTGLLNDGQHRCAAVIESRVSAKTVFIFGIPRDTRDTLDQGTNRSSADYLSMHGSVDTNHLAATAKMVWQWRTFGFTHRTGSYAPTRSQIVDTVEKNPGIAQALHFVSRKGSSLFSSRSVLAFSLFAIRTVVGSHTDPDFFFDSLIDGANLTAGDPILLVRNRLMTERKILLAPAKAELLFRAWNAHRLGQTRVLFRVNGGELPLLEA
jgi:hypothetical protein